MDSSNDAGIQWASRSHRHPLYSPPCGPGKAVRAPPGTPYRIAGKPITRRITYNESGQAVLKLESNQSSSAETAMPRTASNAVNSVGTSDTERTVTAEEEAIFNTMMASLPLLRVLPPAVLHEHRYLDNSNNSAADTGGVAALNGRGGSDGLSVVVNIGSSCDDHNTLRSLAWGGCRPESLRAATWRLLTDYAPPAVARQSRELQRKRVQYADYTKQYVNATEIETLIFNMSGHAQQPVGVRLAAYSPILSGDHHATSFSTLTPDERAILNQIALDLPRHKMAFYHCRRTATAMARCLFLWSQRHPAVGYVQGMDDIFAIFYQVFLADSFRQVGHRGGSLDALSTEALDAVLEAMPAEYLLQVEADTYWCAGRMLSLLQDNFTRGQPGIVKCATSLEALIAKEDSGFLQELEEGGIRLLDGCFQWFHCLLARELPLPLLLRLWDTYLTIGGDTLLQFHVCVCGALVLSLRPRVRSAAMDVVMQTFKNPFYSLFPPVFQRGGPLEIEADYTRQTQEWLDVIIADAYRLWRQNA